MGQRVMRRPPKYVQGFIDRHGKPRWYFRRPGFKRVPLPGLPWSPEFMAAYETALAETPRMEIGASRTVAGTVNAVVIGYFGSAAFHNLAPASQRQYRGIMGRFRREHGDKRIAMLQRRHVREMLDAKASTPIAARNLLYCARVLIRYAIDIGLRADDPTTGIRVGAPKSAGFRTWSEDDIAAFEAHYPIGSKPRLALALLLHTGQRRADVVKMGRQHIRDGLLFVRQQKTGAVLSIPVSPALSEVLDATPNEHLTFLVTDRGQPFEPQAFTKWFRRCCDAAGLSKTCSAHGLRKATCRRLAEAGCSANEIASISGHASLREVERYTRAADQARMARQAIARTEQQHQVSNRPETSVKPGRKTLKQL
jgi:integrase